MKGITERAELVKSAAEIAVTADWRLRSVEESVMRDIRLALGLRGP